MAKCCKGATCACVVNAGAHITVSGTGSSQSPFTVTGDVGLTVTDTTTFDFTLAGTGTAADPWNLSMGYKSTAKLNQIPDVNAPSPTNTQVLSWDTATSKWIPRNPTTAAAGTVSTDTSMQGDGSGGSPLQVKEDPARFLQTVTAGLGVNDTGVNQMVRKYGDATARTAGTPAYTLNSVTMLDSEPGVMWYYTGSTHVRLVIPKNDISGGELLAMSGSYGGTQLTQMVRNLSFTTDGSGNFDVLTSTDLTGKSGVLNAFFQPTGSLAYTVLLNGSVNKIVGTAYRLDTGAAYTGVSLTGLVRALVY